MFFLKEKPFKITAYTYDKTVYDYNKPTIGTEKLPEIFTSVPKYNKITERSLMQSNGINVNNNDPRLHQMNNNSGMPIANLDVEIKLPTIATCPGIREFYSVPIQMKMWGESDVTVLPNGEWGCAINPMYGMKMTHHGQEQYGNMYSNRVFIKIDSPWYFSTDDSVNVLFTESHYSSNFFRDNDLIVPPGILNFKYQPATNVHIGYKIKPDPYTISWKLNQPLVSMFALTERPVVIEHKLISQADWMSIASFPKCAIGRYFKKVQIMKKLGKHAPSPDTHLKERMKR